MKVKKLVPQLNKDTFVDDYFRACGIEDVKEFKNPVGRYVGDVKEYSAIGRKVRLFEEYLNKAMETQSKIAIVQDCDVDGICSATMAFFMLERYGFQPEDVVFLYHSDKTHGLTDEIMQQIVAQNDISMVIVPDAGSNDLERISFLLDIKINVVILDHHEVDKRYLSWLDTLQRSPGFIIVNNQLENRTNKDLCGTGVVFRFFQAFEMSFSPYDHGEYANHLDIVALANIADVMDMRNLENIVFNRWGLWRAIENDFLWNLCKKYCKKIVGITPEDIAWNIAPKLNAVCRSEDQETKAMVLEAFCGMREDYDDVIKAIERCYRKQREMVKDTYESLIYDDNYYELDSFGKVVIRFCAKSPYTGLIANKLMEYYNKPVLLVHTDGDLCTGSCRSPIPIREQIVECPEIIFAQGHEHAFGVCWKKSNTKVLVDYLESLELDYDQEITVASTLDPSHIPTWLFRVAEEYARCWGTGVESPKFYIPRIRINAKDIRELGNGTVLKFTYKDVEYVEFFASKRDKEKLLIGKNKPLIIDLIGSLGVNLYQGKETLQVKIDRFEIVEERWEDIW